MDDVIEEDVEWYVNKLLLIIVFVHLFVFIYVSKASTLFAIKRVYAK